MTADPAATSGIVQRTRLAAYAWCEGDGAVLLCRLRMDDPDGGAWTLPGGGLEFGEDPVSGVLRELAEETGYAAHIDGLAGIRSEVWEPEETSSGHRLHYVAILYQATVTGGSLRDEPDGSTDHAEWVPLAEVNALRLVELVAWARATVGR